jgi:hypothetical protein
MPSSPPNATTLAKWTNTKDWQELLRLNARSIRGSNPTPPYSDAYTLPFRNNAEQVMLRLQTYDFVVRYAQVEWTSGAVHDGTAPPDKQWKLA